MPAIMTEAAEAEWNRFNKSVAEYSDLDLLARAVLRICCDRRPGVPNWSAVMEGLCTGSSYGNAICRRFGLNPDATQPKRGGVAKHLQGL